MKDASPAFRKLDNGKIVPIGYQRVNCHMIFDIKMKYLCRRARLIAIGHMTDPPSTVTYSIILSRETVNIALKLVALNDLLVKVANIKNAYIMAPVTEKIWPFLGRMFGEDAGRKVIIVHALYGLKSARVAFQNHLTDCMHHLGFIPCHTDLDL